MLTTLESRAAAAESEFGCGAHRDRRRSGHESERIHFKRSRAGVSIRTGSLTGSRTGSLRPHRDARVRSQRRRRIAGRSSKGRSGISPPVRRRSSIDSAESKAAASECTSHRQPCCSPPTTPRRPRPKPQTASHRRSTAAVHRARHCRVEAMRRGDRVGTCQFVSGGGMAREVFTVARRSCGCAAGKATLATGRNRGAALASRCGTRVKAGSDGMCALPLFLPTFVGNAAQECSPPLGTSIHEGI